MPKAYRKTRIRSRVDEDGIAERFCTRCGEWVLLELFCKSAKCHQGRTLECKGCKNKRKAANDRRRS